MEQDRRDFLKKAGAVAWAVPAMQAVNMAAAAAGVEGSVVSTTRPPASTSTTTTTTTEAPELCDCSIEVVDVEPHFSAYIFMMQVALDEVCAEEITRGTVVAHPNSGGPANLPRFGLYNWQISVQAENLPADITMEFYANNVLKATCGVRLEVDVPV